ncbi:MAG TPA: flagella accessory protein C [Candidatus Lokiarchaeia archaeon]
MGKGEDESEDSDTKTTSAEDKKDEHIKPEKESTENKNTEVPKKNVEEIRKVIKLNSTEEKPQKKEETPKEKEPVGNNLEDSTRESLEQKRAILQSIKDFDFQIKKNREDITALNKKLDSASKDLDDLVSLYEIVSEQMNPFVGLSKVTKKRIDALENFIKEIEDLKERTGELESFAERSGAKLKIIGEGERQHTKTIDTDEILGEEKTETEDEIIEVNVAQEEVEQSMIVSTMSNNIFKDISDDELDKILERALGTLSVDGQIDMMIDDFIESLKR